MIRNMQNISKFWIQKNFKYTYLLKNITSYIEKK